MAVNKENFEKITAELSTKNVSLVAVSKTKPAEDIMELYNLGQRDFGENYVQELVDKAASLPMDIKWHFIGHLQSNKVKQITHIVHLIHGVDSLKLLKEINKQAAKDGVVVKCLLQVHIAQEENKFGMNEEEIVNVLAEIKQVPASYSNIFVAGLMGMASFSDNEDQVRGEFKFLKYLFDKYKSVVTPNCAFSILSMGMSGDYKWATEEGSTMVRIGSLLFGARN